MFSRQIAFVIVLIISGSKFATTSTDTTDINYFETYYNEPPTSSGRNAVRNDKFKWPSGTVPYIFHSNYTADERMRVEAAMKLFTELTCTKFIPKTDAHVEHIRFVKAEGCGSNIGCRRGQREPLDVSYNAHCLTLNGAMQHEMLHVLGLLHEQCRPDRDDYVTVVWENIEPQFYNNFRKMSNNVVETFGLPYDYDSLMHYPTNAFARRGTNVTMFATRNSSRDLGQSEAPTYYDMEKVRLMYNCTDIGH